jgi:hypothetical protein
MSAITEGWIPSLFTGTERHLRGFLDRKRLGHKFCTFMCAIAERLIAGEAAGTPIVSTWFQSHHNWFSSSNGGNIAHSVLLSSRHRVVTFNRLSHIKQKNFSILTGLDGDCLPWLDRHGITSF